jgi:hypothetical protein
MATVLFSVGGIGSLLCLDVCHGHCWHFHAKAGTSQDELKPRKQESSDTKVKKRLWTAALRLKCSVGDHRSSVTLNERHKALIGGLTEMKGAIALIRHYLRRPPQYEKTP